MKQTRKNSSHRLTVRIVTLALAILLAAGTAFYTIAFLIGLFL